MYTYNIVVIIFAYVEKKNATWRFINKVMEGGTPLGPMVSG